MFELYLLDLGCKISDFSILLHDLYFILKLDDRLQTQEITIPMVQETSFFCYRESVNKI